MNEETDKKSFVLTGYVQRSTCNCGCMSDNAFWQDRGFGGSYHLAKLHSGIEKFCDELSGAGPGGQGKACDVKVTITIEKLGDHDHRLVNRGSFSGGGMEINQKLRAEILKPAEAENPEELDGAEVFKIAKERGKDLHKQVPTSYLQDMHDQMLLAKRTNDFSLLEELMEELQDYINRKAD